MIYLNFDISKFPNPKEFKYAALQSCFIKIFFFLLLNYLLELFVKDETTIASENSNRRSSLKILSLQLHTHKKK